MSLVWSVCHFRTAVSAMRKGKKIQVFSDEKKLKIAPPSCFQNKLATIVNHSPSKYLFGRLMHVSGTLNSPVALKAFFFLEFALLFQSVMETFLGQSFVAKNRCFLQNLASGKCELFIAQITSTYVFFVFHWSV